MTVLPLYGRVVVVGCCGGGPACRFGLIRGREPCSSPLVLWSIFDADNIEFYPQCWIGLWVEEENRLFLGYCVCVTGQHRGIT